MVERPRVHAAGAVQPADVVHEVVLDGDAPAAGLDVDPYLAVGIAGVGADATDIVDVVANDLRMPAAVVEVDAAGAAPRAADIADVGHLEALDADVVGSREDDAFGRVVVLAPHVGAPPRA